MTKLLFIAGAPGSGKTTISNILRNKLEDPVLIDFGILREIHLKPDWSDQSPKEEQMAFENLIFILNNYIRNGYQYVIVNDLRDHRVVEIPKHFEPKNFMIFTLIVNSEQELSRRVLDPDRDSGFRSVDAALEWNRKLKERDPVRNELKIDNTENDPGKTADMILEILDQN